MVKGKFKCLGSPQHLKNKFGNVYILKVKFNMDTDENKLEDFKKFFHLPNILKLYVRLVATQYKETPFITPFAVIREEP